MRVYVILLVSAVVVLAAIRLVWPRILWWLEERRVDRQIEQWEGGGVELLGITPSGSVIHERYEDGMVRVLSEDGVAYYSAEEWKQIDEKKTTWGSDDEEKVESLREAYGGELKESRRARGVACELPRRS